jgi:hypothetical protein
MWFEQVDSPGITTVETLMDEDLPGDPPSSANFDLAGNYFDINTTADFTGRVEICFTYDENDLVGPENTLKLLHYTDVPPPLEWKDITLTPIDTVNKIICGEATKLSPFVMATSKQASEEEPPPPDDDTETLSGRGCSVTPTLSNMSTGSAWANLLILLLPLVVFGIRRRRGTGKK